ncbi:DUF2487 family protein [Paenibacillus athensensis]|uniref:DUF2487 domain-containing protein n=1 Tax=Paenibacillus athensensis TaxID=1967502 RepID=A0A4Y8Q864_9BACL|nr:DUF2487 family protein [Paenibacillus athensensis]MCD1260249.1 DUF2487 family protein [Paenibacillus athensensis]
MKFSDIKEEEWEGLRPYLDTCLLPVTGLSGAEAPWRTTGALEQLADVLELLELPYKGRVVTYPALHYSRTAAAEDQADEVCRELKDGGFAYVVIVTSDQAAASWQVEHADLLIYVDPAQLAGDRTGAKAEAANRIQQLWRGR